MSNLYDSTFWIHVAIGALFLILFIGMLYCDKLFKKIVHDYDQDDIELNRANNFVSEVIRCIGESETVQELKSYQNEADQFFIDNYEVFGQEQSMKFYNTMTQAVIKRQNELNEKV